MKKVLIAALMALVAVAVVPLCLTGCGAVHSEGLSYTPIEDAPGTCVLSGLGSYSGTHLVVPEQSPAGDTVVAVGVYAFKDEGSITSVTLPDTVKEIRLGAFMGCEALVEVHFGGALESVAELAFADCTALERFTSTGLASEMKLNINYGQNQDTGEAVTVEVAQRLLMFPETLTVIGEGAFRKCEKLNGLLVLRDHVESVGDHAFAYCESLPLAYFYEGIDFLGSEIFKGVSELYLGVGNEAAPDAWSESWNRQSGAILLNCDMGLPFQSELDRYGRIEKEGYTSRMVRYMQIW